MNDACCALYITALVAGVLELETNVLHVPDLTVGCICTPTMVAIPLFLLYIFYVWLEDINGINMHTDFSNSLMMHHTCLIKYSKTCCSPSCCHPNISLYVCMFCAVSHNAKAWHFHIWLTLSIYE
jgi:hypothetical protein